MDEQIKVPYIVYESSMARAERQQKRLWIALIVSVVMIVLSNIAWLYVWNSYEYVGESQVSVEGDGTANYIGSDGNQNEVPQEKER